MPLPSVYSQNIPTDFQTVNSVVASSGNNKDDFSFEYELSQPISYEEWGSPATKEEEMFYIAMRWPYKPDIVDASLEKFKQVYKFEDLYGSAADYKKRRVLVFSPLTGRAVVCAPAYFLWGEGDDDVDAVVSTDAAWYLGTFVSTIDDKIAADGGQLAESLPAWANLSLHDRIDAGNSLLEKIEAET